MSQERVELPTSKREFEPRPTQAAETTVPRSGAGHLSGRATRSSLRPGDRIV
jgi:hypothetical protein